MSKFLLRNGQTFVFVGDSITDCGRRDSAAPFGNGYVRMAVDLIAARYPERQIRFLNEGIGGNTIVDLRNRWHDDVLRHRPDWVSVKIGINDLHRSFWPNEADRIPPRRFETVYREILDLTRKKTKARLLLIDPFYISTDTAPGGFRAQVLDLIPRYLAVVHRLARDYDALLVRTHDAFRAQLRHRLPDYFCPEPVHPYPSGHLVIAHEVLRTLGW